MAPQTTEQESRHDVDRLITKSKIKETYLLSDSWIKKLGPPDKTKPNPFYKNAAPMQLYCLDRLVAFLDEHHEEYFRWLKRREKLSASAKRQQDRKREESREWARSVEFEISPFPKNLMEAAQLHFTCRSLERFQEIDPEAVNLNGVLAFLRHNYTNYDNICRQLFGRIGQDDAHWIINERLEPLILEAIYREHGSEFFRSLVRKLEIRHPMLEGCFRRLLTGHEDNVLVNESIPASARFQLSELADVFRKLNIDFPIL